MRCLRCGRDYVNRPAMSRRDNKTDICPMCGTAEAMFDLQFAKVMVYGTAVEQQAMDYLAVAERAWLNYVV